MKLAKLNKKDKETIALACYCAMHESQGAIGWFVAGDYEKKIERFLNGVEFLLCAFSEFKGEDEKEFMESLPEKMHKNFLELLVSEGYEYGAQKTVAEAYEFQMVPEMVQKLKVDRKTGIKKPVLDKNKKPVLVENKDEKTGMVIKEKKKVLVKKHYHPALTGYRSLSKERRLRPVMFIRAFRLFYEQITGKQLA